mgnify:CR=1 FL=1
MDYFVFGTVDTRNYNIHIFNMNIDEAPASLAQEITVPGRNGALLVKNNYYENIAHRYMGVVYENAGENLKNFRAAMMEDVGYQRLTDSFHTDEFYQARYVGGLEPTITPDRNMAKFAIEFSRKPQRFLVSGETAVSVSNGSSITNPTRFEARPIIRTRGSGTFSVGGVSVTVDSNSYSYIDIDCEMMDSYCGATNCNQLVHFANYKFPTLKKGSSYISSSGFSSISITPRWWTL